VIVDVWLYVIHSTEKDNDVTWRMVHRMFFLSLKFCVSRLLCTPKKSIKPKITFLKPLKT